MSSAFNAASESMIGRVFPRLGWFAGDSVLRSECESLIDELDLRGTFFLLGYRYDSSKSIPIPSFTVLSSIWEGLPVVFQEAMGAGKSTVAIDFAGDRDVIINGETGYLVTSLRFEEMAERLFMFAQ